MEVPYLAPQSFARRVGETGLPRVVLQVLVQQFDDLSTMGFCRIAEGIVVHPIGASETGRQRVEREDRRQQ